MATIAEGGLFPPIIQAYLPAIAIKNEEPFITIPYNTSEYNTLSDIKSIQISITRQSNYDSLFDKNKYRRGIYVINNTSLTSEDNTLTISKDILNMSQLSYNEYYKVQLRFSKIPCPVNAEPGQACLIGEQLSLYLLDESNLTQFSEWSTVCLIRFIAPPVITIDSTAGLIYPSQDQPTLHSSNLTIYGNYKKENINAPDNPFPSEIDNGTIDKEYLSSYQIKLLTIDNSPEVIFDSGSINVNKENPNEFYYEIPYFFNNNDTLTLQFTYVTANLYTETLSNNISVSYDSSSWVNQSYVEEVTSIDNVIGKVNISFMPQDEEVPVPAGSILTVRRGNDQDGFKIWDTIWSKTLQSPLDTTLSVDDFTVESGVLYKYEITFTDPSTNDNYTIVEGPVMTIFDHAFLTGEGTQLCVKFNPNIGSYKINVGDNITNTLGSQYPFTQRNGDMYYRTFSLSGTIAYEMDVQHQFYTRTEMYGEWIDVYGSYFVNHYINQQNDKITQRKFREKVMEYLYNDIPKLFRSTPEGNILVTITDVNLTPNQQIGRLVYDFSCTATEIGEASIENCKLYKIQDFGDL